MGLSEQTGFWGGLWAPQKEFAPEHPHDFSNRYRETRTTRPFRDTHDRLTLTSYPAGFVDLPHPFHLSAPSTNRSSNPSNSRTVSVPGARPSAAQRFARRWSSSLT